MNSSKHTMMKTKFLPTALLVVVLLTIPATASHVYVVHGYGSNRFVMRGLCRHLEKHGYTVTNWGYASLRKGLPEIGRRLYQEVCSHSPGDTLHFVTHSMGGLVVRAMLRNVHADTALPTISRIVMLTPPNKGAEIADFFAQLEVVNWIMGPNLKHMKTDSASLANTLPAPRDREIGIIAGARFDGEGYSPFIAGDDDGFMSIDKTKLGTEKDFIVVPQGHIFIIHDRSVKENVLSFLRHGHFMSPGTIDK